MTLVLMLRRAEHHVCMKSGRGAFRLLFFSLMHMHLGACAYATISWCAREITRLWTMDCHRRHSYAAQRCSFSKAFKAFKAFTRSNIPELQWKLTIGLL